MQYFALMVPNDARSAERQPPPHALGTHGIRKVLGRLNRNIGITYTKTELAQTVGVLALELSSGFDDSVVLKGERLRRLCRQIEDICRVESCGRIIFPSNYPPFDPVCDNISAVMAANRCDFLQTGRRFLRIALPDLFKAYLDTHGLKYAEVLIIQDGSQSGSMLGGGIPVGGVMSGSAVLSGSGEAVNVIRMLSLYIKMAAVYNASPSEIGQIFTDTGMPVIAPSNIQSAAKSADIVINFCAGGSGISGGGGMDGVKTMKLKKSAIIINFGDSGVNRLKIENPVINGIRIGLPDSFRDTIPGARETLGFFDVQLIAETILALMANSSGLPDDFRDAARIEAFARYYKKAGFTITGCYGRHGLLKEFLTIK